MNPAAWHGQRPSQMPMPVRVSHFPQVPQSTSAVTHYRVVRPAAYPVRTAAPAHASPPTRLWRMLRVGAAAVQVMEEPSMQSKRLPWVVQQPGDVVLTSGRTHGDWVELLFAHLRKGWAPLSSFVPHGLGGYHGDGLYDGANRAIRQHQSEMQHIHLEPNLPEPALRAPSKSFHLQKEAWQAYVWLPELASPGPLPLLVAFHGSRPMDWDFLSFAERWQKDASAYQIAVLVPESVGPTWDYLLTCQRRDMDFIEYAINQTRCQVSIDDQQIAIMGMSDGASLAMSMALRNPGIFRTALVQATGFFHDTAPDTLKPRVYMEYGTEDKLFGPDTVARPTRDRLRDLGCPVEFAMIDGAGHMVQEEFFGAALDFWLGGPVANTEKFKK
ncbi:unnamed protein product [Durusdinium trenchii]